MTDADEVAREPARRVVVALAKSDGKAGFPEADKVGQAPKYHAPGLADSAKPGDFRLRWKFGRDVLDVDEVSLHRAQPFELLRQRPGVRANLFVAQVKERLG